MKVLNRAFAITCLNKQKEWEITCREGLYYNISFDGFYLEEEMNKLRGMYPLNKYKIIEVRLVVTNTEAKA